VILGYIKAAFEALVDILHAGVIFARVFVKMYLLIILFGVGACVLLAVGTVFFGYVGLESWSYGLGATLSIVLLILLPLTLPIGWFLNRGQGDLHLRIGAQTIGAAIWLGPITFFVVRNIPETFSPHCSI